MDTFNQKKKFFFDVRSNITSGACGTAIHKRAPRMLHGQHFPSSLSHSVSLSHSHSHSLVPKPQCQPKDGRVLFWKAFTSPILTILLVVGWPTYTEDNGLRSRVIVSQLVSHGPLSSVLKRN